MTFQSAKVSPRNHSHRFPDLLSAPSARGWRANFTRFLPEVMHHLRSNQAKRFPFDAQVVLLKELSKGQARRWIRFPSC